MPYIIFKVIVCLHLYGKQVHKWCATPVAYLLYINTASFDMYYQYDAQYEKNTF